MGSQGVVAPAGWSPGGKFTPGPVVTLGEGNKVVEDRGRPAGSGSHILFVQFMSTEAKFTDDQ